MPLNAAPQLDLHSPDKLRTWLEKNHKTSGEIWLVRHKKGSPYYYPVELAVKELLCFGWIDSLPRKLDKDHSLLYIAPRKPKSNWSRVNKDFVSELIAAGRMMDAGLKAIEIAKSNGRWTFLDEIEQGILPKDIADALSLDPKVASNFAAFPRSVKKGILEWIISAAKDKTRSDRILRTVEDARKNKRSNFDK